MKIAIVTGDDIVSNPRLVWEARALAAAHHRVTVYGVLSPATEEEEDEAGVVHVRMPLRGWRARGGGLRSPLRLAGWYDRFRPVVEAAVTRERPDAIHALDLDVAGPAQDAAIALGVPFVFDVAGAAYVDRLAQTFGPRVRGAGAPAWAAATDLLRRKGAALEKKLRRRGLAALVTDTQSLGEDLVRRYGGPPATVVRNCPPFHAARRTDALRRRIGAFPKERLLLFLGPVTPGCGIDAAIRALRLLGDGYLLVVVGRTPRLAAFEDLAEREGVLSQVRFVAPAPADEMAELIASGDVALVPTEPVDASHRLALPSSFFLALAAGLPVVASDTREVGALVRRTGAGVLYPARSPQDPAALAEAVHVLAQDASLLETCRENAIDACRLELNWENESLALIDLYDRLA